MASYWTRISYYSHNNKVVWFFKFISCTIVSWIFHWHLYMIMWLIRVNSYKWHVSLPIFWYDLWHLVRCFDCRRPDMLWAYKLYNQVSVEPKWNKCYKTIGCTCFAEDNRLHVDAAAVKWLYSLYLETIVATSKDYWSNSDWYASTNREAKEHSQNVNNHTSTNISIMCMKNEAKK